MKSTGFIICAFILLMRHEVTSYGDETQNQELLGNRHRILEKILEGYDCRLGPPGVIVDLRLELLEFRVSNDLNKVEGDFWFYMCWRDWRLEWNPDNFGGVDQINVMDTDVKIWRPDISVYNSIYPIPTFDPANFRIYSNGTVEFLAQNANILVSCYDPPLNLKTNPRAVQNCTMVLGSWGFTQDTFRLKCTEPISHTSDDFRDIWDYRIIRTPDPVRTQQTFGQNTYAECLYTLIFRKKRENLSKIDYN